MEVLEEHVVEVDSLFNRERRKPIVGMEFESLEEIYEFYNTYAKKTGFGVRKHTTIYWPKTKELMKKYYVCSKEGITRGDLGGKGKRRHMIIREECKARIAVFKKKDRTTWTITHFVEEHNHQLATPRKVDFLRSHRNVSNAKKDLSKLFAEANIPMRQQIAIYEIQAGGPEHMGCTQKDLYNYQRDLRKDAFGHDVMLLQEHFVAKQEKNSSFYYKMEVDGENRLDRVFWADATSRRAFGFYGDVIVFDTTYNTNRYDMKFAPIVGVNKHGSTILFACAFLANEKIDSFTWLFEQFKIAMPSCKPKMIITDQDAAINVAVAISFPDTKHRLCIWHILKKFPEKLDSKSQFYDYNVFRQCIWNSESPEEFELSWVLAVEKNNALGNVWLCSIYELREKWVPAYVNNVFSAGMSSSQRVESSHAFFKGYVSKRNSLFEFLIRFNRALGHQRHIELEKDHIDVHSKPVIKSPMSMERQIASIYTRKIFLEFQKELWLSMACVLVLDKENGNKCYYIVAERVTRENGDCSSRKERTITHDRDIDYVSCSCKKFESEGITCRHMLACLKMFQVELLPEKYIYKRWTKVANVDTIFDKSGSVIRDVVDGSLLMKKSRLSTLAANIIEKALSSESTSRYLFEKFENIYEALSTMVGNLNIERPIVCGEASKGSLKRVINDPIEKRLINSGKRLKGGAEKAMEKLERRCHGCGQTGHDKRTCLVVKNARDAEMID